MKQFFEFIPLIIFFAAYKLYDIYVGTAALMVATGVMLLVTWLKYKKLEKMHIITFVMIIGFGSLTLLLRDDAFIKWKVTVVYAFFAAGLLISHYGFKKNLLKQMLGKELKLPEPVWSKLNLAWAGFFTFCGLLNIYVAFYLSQDFWVNFKVFGLMGLMLVFTIFTGVYLYKYLPKDEKE
ncbi:septation protein A [Motilimonas pumila]|uniref:Inner membrane-spanning protein YciB n=1 Tax=Motilimonas pumila TaxID=2303987 RepID=A0A418YGU2_9GAMM|nr:septation protein A [Motilimonas pumila]RJG49060.1 septation protein A [Motilimonas pumila]